MALFSLTIHPSLVLGNRLFLFVSLPLNLLLTFTGQTFYCRLFFTMPHPLSYRFQCLGMFTIPRSLSKRLLLPSLPHGQPGGCALCGCASHSLHFFRQGTPLLLSITTASFFLCTSFPSRSIRLSIVRRPCGLRTCARWYLHFLSRLFFVRCADFPRFCPLCPDHFRMFPEFSGLCTTERLRFVQAKVTTSHIHVARAFFSFSVQSSLPAHPDAALSQTHPRLCHPHLCFHRVWFFGSSRTFRRTSGSVQSKKRWCHATRQCTRMECFPQRNRSVTLQPTKLPTRGHLNVTCSIPQEGVTTTILT